MRLGGGGLGGQACAAAPQRPQRSRHPLPPATRHAEPPAKQTFEGVDVCGTRLAEEIRGLTAAHPNLARVTVLAHSMGGLISRYALGKLFDPGTQTIAGGRGGAADVGDCQQWRLSWFCVELPPAYQAAGGPCVFCALQACGPATLLPLPHPTWAATATAARRKCRSSAGPTQYPESASSSTE